MSLKLTVSDIWKSYSGNPVLKGASFSFESGSLYILTGANGSGKSTLLRICSLIEEPDKGRVDYSSDNGILAKDMSLMRRITLLLPDVGIFNTTVLKNAAYGLKIRGLMKKEMEEKALEALELAGLSAKKDQNALTLSSGERQRLGIARAAVIEPEIFLLDEPTASVDAKNTVIIEEMIKKMNKRGTTIIMTTHDPLQSSRLADCTLSVNEGMILKV